MQWAAAAQTRPSTAVGQQLQSASSPLRGHEHRLFLASRPWTRARCIVFRPLLWSQLIDEEKKLSKNSQSYPGVTAASRVDSACAEGRSHGSQRNAVLWPVAGAGCPVGVGHAFRWTLRGGCGKGNEPSGIARGGRGSSPADHDAHTHHGARGFQRGRAVVLLGIGGGRSSRLLSVFSWGRLCVISVHRDT